jgi:hypothetical protein
VTLLAFTLITVSDLEQIGWFLAKFPQGHFWTWCSLNDLLYTKEVTLRRKTVHQKSNIWFSQKLIDLFCSIFRTNMGTIYLMLVQKISQNLKQVSEIFTILCHCTHIWFSQKGIDIFCSNFRTHMGTIYLMLVQKISQNLKQVSEIFTILGHYTHI